jgi:hypothetical protein
MGTQVRPTRCDGCDHGIHYGQSCRFCGCRYNSLLELRTPAAIEEHKKLVEELAPEMLRLLREIEWNGDRQGEVACPACFYEKVYGHREGCALDVVLTAARKVPE